MYPHNDSSLHPLELGASIFVKANKNLVRASQHFSLNLSKFDTGVSVAIWDGENIRFAVGIFAS